MPDWEKGMMDVLLLPESIALPDWDIIEDKEILPEDQLIKNLWFAYC